MMAATRTMVPRHRWGGKRYGAGRKTALLVPILPAFVFLRDCPEKRPSGGRFMALSSTSQVHLQDTSRSWY
jgi:hypothetical protein